LVRLGVHVNGHPIFFIEWINYKRFKFLIP